MKIYSDLTKKFYESVEDCEKAEKEFEEEKEKLALEKSTKDKEVSKRKKELSDKIEAAEKAVDEAYKRYYKVKEETDNDLAECLKKCKERLTESKTELIQCEEEKTNAIREFNQEFGTFQKRYTGDKAITEFNRWVNAFDRLFDFPLIF